MIGAYQRFVIKWKQSLSAMRVFSKGEMRLDAIIDSSDKEFKLFLTIIIRFMKILIFIMF